MLVSLAGCSLLAHELKMKLHIAFLQIDSPCMIHICASNETFFSKIAILAVLMLATGSLVLWGILILLAGSNLSILRGIYMHIAKHNVINFWKGHPS